MGIILYWILGSNVGMCGLDVSGSGQGLEAGFLTRRVTFSFSRRTLLHGVSQPVSQLVS